ncbi:VCBS repeat-containing protein [bacterium]|nr:VCBS repeat-containing protein [bacterium]
MKTDARLAGNPAFIAIGRLAIATLAGLACGLLGSCDLLDQAGKGLSNGFNNNQNQAQTQQPAVAPGMGTPATQQEVDAMWQKLSAEDRQLLQESGMDKGFADSMVGSMDIASIQMMLESQLQMLRPMELHDKGVPVGKALAWKDVVNFESVDGLYSMVLAGNLDSDPEDELLVSQDVQWLVQLDGSEQELKLDPNQQLMATAIWDYDGDGIGEFLATDWNNFTQDESGAEEYKTLVLSTSGERIAELDGNIDMGNASGTDVDGDGHTELILMNYGPQYVPEVLAYGRKGKLVWQPKEAISLMEMASGDIDNDGKDELLAPLYDPNVPYGGRVMACGMGQEPVEVPGLSDNSLAGPPSLCADLNGDGFAEILTGSSLLNPQTGEKTRLAKPEGWDDMQLSWGMGMGLGVIELDGRKLLVARLIEGREEYRSDTVAMWNGAGELVYLEYLGEELQDLKVINGADGQKLMLQTNDRLKVSQ